MKVAYLIFTLVLSMVISPAFAVNNETFNNHSTISNYNSLIQLDSNTYVLAYSGPDSKGFITAFTISADGSTITECASCQLEHDSSNGIFNSLVKVDSNTIALAYTGIYGKGFISTFDITNDGSTIKKVHTSEYAQRAIHNSLIKGERDTFVLAYSDERNRGVITTFTISADGKTIGERTTGELEHAGTLAAYNSLVKVNHDTFVLAYSGDNFRGVITTFTISADGSTITECTSCLETHDSKGENNSLVKVDSNTVALAYTGGNHKGYISTFDITNDGSTITSMDKIEHEGTRVYDNSLVKVDHNTVALAYSGQGEKGFITTFAIDTQSLITKVKTVAYDGIFAGYNSLVKVDYDTFALAYRSNNQNGVITTFTISADGKSIDSIGGDSDSDGITNRADNCPNIVNADQADTDGDGVGDACNDADDSDGDEYSNVLDNCPNIANADQADTDGDYIGDVCESTPTQDTDGDGINDSVDQCPNEPETVNGYQDDDGCPDTVPVVVPKKDDKLNMSTTYFEPIITYDKTVIPWQATISCTILVKIPDNYEAQMVIGFPKSNTYLTDSNNLSFDLPNSRAEKFTGSCKLAQAGEASKYENFVISIEDTDGDEIFNLFDLCPFVAEDHLGPNQSDGCPDTTPPSKPIIVTHDALYIQGRSDLNTTISLYVNDKYIGNTEIKPNGKWVIPYTLPIGTHTIVVYAIDTAGNKSEGATVNYTVSEDDKTNSSGTTTTTNHTGTTDNNPYIVTPKVTPENVNPGTTFTATCEENHSDSNYTWHVAIYDSRPIDMKKPYAQGMVKQSLEYTIPSDYSLNQIVVTCWATLMDDTSHTSITNSKILSWSVPDTDGKSIDNGESTKKQKKSNGGCSDCTPPTLGLDKNFNRIVDDGFSYNGNMVQVEKWYTDFPLINATVGIPNLVEIKVYENQGINNMKWVQFCLGAEERGQPLNFCEVLIEVHLQTFGTTTDIAVQEIVINDKDNLIDNDAVTAVSYVVPCMEYGTEPNCVKVDLEYTYREDTINHMMIVNVVDKARNSQNFHFNEGIKVLGESVNEPPTITLFDKHTSQQKDNLYITYTRIDKIDDTWTDQYGIEYHRINDVTFDRITPADSYECKDPTLDKVKVWKRTNCHFRELTSLWSYN